MMGLAYRHNANFVTWIAGEQKWSTPSPQPRPFALP